jgi:glycosyltransferase involved in cell wall biosynthesis
LAGSTILQIVPALHEEPVARTAVNVAHALLQWGARALIASEGGPLAEELKSYGGEWVPLVNATLNPLRLRNCAKRLERLIASERIDIVHAQSIGGAWAAHMAATQIAVWLVTTLPDVPAVSGLHGYWAGALARGDRVITPSNFAAAPVMARYGLARERLTVIPRSIDTDAFDPRKISAGRVEALRAAWRIAPQDRIVLVPGRVAPWNGQLLLPDLARILLEAGIRGFAFVLAGEHMRFRKYTRFLFEQARESKVQDAIRLGGHCWDMPAAYAAADTVLIPAREPPMLGRIVAEAQSMGRPVIASNIGILPEHMVTPPDMPDRHSSRAHGDSAGHARRCAHRLARPAGGRCGICPCIEHRIFARRCRLSSNVRARAAVCAIHVFPAQHCECHPRGVYIAAGARQLAWHSVVPGSAAMRHVNELRTSGKPEVR